MYLRSGRFLGVDFEPEDNLSHMNYESSHFSVLSLRHNNSDGSSSHYSSASVQGPERSEETSSDDTLSQLDNMDHQGKARVNIVPNSTTVEEQTHSPTSSAAARLYQGFTNMIGRFGFQELEYAGRPIEQHNLPPIAIQPPTLEPMSREPITMEERGEYTLGGSNLRRPLVRFEEYQAGPSQGFPRNILVSFKNKNHLQGFPIYLKTQETDWSN